MSATTLDNPITTTLHRDYLQDYNIRLTGSRTTAAQQADADAQGQGQGAPSSAENSPLPAAANPPGWYDEHRQVPPHRPINAHLSREERPWGTNPMERAFIVHMLGGVWLTAVSFSLLSPRPPFLAIR